MLEIDMRAEQETIKNNRERIRQAERAGEFALSDIKRYYITRTRSRNRSERRPRITIIAEVLLSEVLYYLEQNK